MWESGIEECSALPGDISGTEQRAWVAKWNDAFAALTGRAVRFCLHDSSVAEPQADINLRQSIFVADELNLNIKTITKLLTCLIESLKRSLKHRKCVDWDLN